MRFGEYLAEALKKAGYTQRSFAAKVGHHQQNFNQIILGNRTPPLKHIEAWLAILKEQVDPDLFRELAELEHTPPRIRKLVADLREQIAKLDKPW